MKFLRVLNIFPYPINFNYQFSKNYHSNYAITLSLFFLILIVYLVYYFSYDMLNSTNPKLLKKQVQVEGKHNYNLTEILPKLTWEGYLNNTLESYEDKYDEKGYYISYFNFFDLEIHIEFDDEESGNEFLYVAKFPNHLKLKKPKKEGDLIKFESIDDHWLTDKNVKVPVCKDLEESDLCDDEENYKPLSLFDLTFPMSAGLKIKTYLKINEKSLKNFYGS